jgi:hypothetical protein
VFWGAVGNCDESGVAGGGNWLLVTWPEGAAGSGAGWVESNEEKRELEQPLASSTASATAANPVPENVPLLKSVIATSARPSWTPS